jgi:ABC-type antimicrobial peptide transport system permease subunit
MRIGVVRGRPFAAADDAAGQPVAIVSRQFAERLLAGGDAIGRVLIRTALDSPPVTVVGVVDDVLDVSTTQAAEPTLYLPWAQNNNSNSPVAFVIRTGVDPASLAPSVRSVVKGIDAALPLRRVQPLAAFVSESTAPERFRTIVLGLIAAFGLVLAAVGIAGVTYRGVVDRSREFAVRLALGSPPAAVIGMVLRESARDLAVGAAGGLAGGAALCVVVARSLEHVGTVDAASAGAVVALMASVGLAAAWVPTWRVRRVRPADVLRS